MITIKFGKIHYGDKTPWAIGLYTMGWWVYYLPELGKWFLSSSDLFVEEQVSPTFAGINPELPET